MPDEMFFSQDERALVRGKRMARRTETCRPSVVTLKDGRKLKGVILNLNAHGVLVRLMEDLDVGVVAHVQLMRDDEFTKPMAPPKVGKVVRHDASDGTFFDLAIKFAEARLPGRREPRPVSNRPTDAPAPTPTARGSRMQNLDITLGGPRRGGRRG